MTTPTLSTLLATWLNDPTISEIMIDGAARVYVERQGTFEDIASPFHDNTHLLDTIQATASATGRDLNDHAPIVDLRLPDGTRAHVVLPPVTRFPVLNIRKIPSKPLTIEELITFGAWSPEMVEFLRAAVQAGLNIAVSGGIGSGKTTGLNLLGSMIPANERILIVENHTDLRLPHKYQVTLEQQLPAANGQSPTTVRQLVQSALRMRPDRIILGEARNGEVLDMFEAMNAGYDGSLFSLHANSPRDALSRLEMMAMMANASLPILTVRETIASALHLIVQMERLPDGVRRVIAITEVQGLRGDVIATEDIFVYHQTSFALGGADGRIQGHFTATGRIPAALQRMRSVGLDFSLDLFKPSSSTTRP